VVGRVSGGHVGEAGLHAHAHEGQQAGLLPGPVLGELGVAELHARLLERLVGVRLRQRHRHVEVVAAGRLRGREDRRVEARVAGVQHEVDPLLAGELLDRGLVRGVQRGAPDAVVAKPVGHAPRARPVHVGQEHPLREAAPARDRGYRLSDPAGAYDQDPHGYFFPS
jgi:hypothetical protein